MKGLGGEIGCGRGKQRESRRNGRWGLSSGAPSHLETSLVAALLEMDSAAAQSYLHPNASVSVSGGGGTERGWSLNFLHLIAPEYQILLVYWHDTYSVNISVCPGPESWTNMSQR